MGAKLESLSSGRGRRKRTVVSEINVTPLVDVMLVLLVIFMITAPMLVSGINVDLPETDTKPVSGQDEPITITVDKQGTVFIGDTKLPREEIAAKLKAITKEKFDTRIFVRGDKSADYGTVIEVVSEISEAGFSKVSLITKLRYEK